MEEWEQLKAKVEKMRAQSTIVPEVLYSHWIWIEDEADRVNSWVSKN